MLMDLLHAQNDVRYHGQCKGLASQRETSSRRIGSIVLQNPLLLPQVFGDIYRKTRPIKAIRKVKLGML
jgi:hypothetical protein